MPETVYLVKNEERYEEIMSAIDKIVSLCTQEDPNTKVKVSHDPLTGTSIGLEITSGSLSVRDIKKFCEGLLVADVFGIMGLKNCKFLFEFSFQRAMKPAPPHTDNSPFPEHEAPTDNLAYEFKKGKGFTKK